MLPQICVGNPLKNGWFLVTQDLTKPADFRRLFYPEIRLKTAPFSPDTFVLRHFLSSIRLLIRHPSLNEQDPKAYAKSSHQ